MHAWTLDLGRLDVAGVATRLVGRGPRRPRRPRAGPVLRDPARLGGRRGGAGWATIGPTDGVTYLAFQTSPGYERPVWPSADGAQQMMMHLDFQVDDLDAAVAHAVDLGAQEAQYQPQDDVRVLLDPAGHPFCLYLDTES